jgi:hypothetical protein
VKDYALVMTNLAGLRYPILGRVRLGVQVRGGQLGCAGPTTGTGKASAGWDGFKVETRFSPWPYERKNFFELQNFYNLQTYLKSNQI